MKLIDKLPYFYDNGYTRPIIEAEQVEADILYREIAETLKQCFVSTATWGLDYWEDMLFLPRGTGKTYDERRSIIYARMRATRTTTVEVVKELASAFFGPENVTVTEHNENYYFNIEFENIKASTVKLQDVIDVLEIYKPAHLNYNFTFSTRNSVQINSDTKKGYCRLPICNTFDAGTWWTNCTEGISNKGKVIQAKSYDGYSYLPICGIYICKRKGRKGYIESNAIVGYASVGYAIVGETIMCDSTVGYVRVGQAIVEKSLIGEPIGQEEIGKSQIGRFQIGYSQLL